MEGRTPHDSHPNVKKQNQKTKQFTNSTFSIAQLSIPASLLILAFLAETASQSCISPRHLLGEKPCRMR